MDAWQRPLMQGWPFLQHVELLQHVSSRLQTFVPQHTAPVGAQNGDALVVQQCSLEPHLVLPQQVLPAVIQNGLSPVVQHCFLGSHFPLPQQIRPVVMQNGFSPVVQHVPLLPEHGGLQVWAWSDAGFHAATTPPSSAPPISRITPRRDVGLASSRAILSMS